jgi:hypothetical protein
MHGCFQCRPVPGHRIALWCPASLPHFHPHPTQYAHFQPPALVSPILASVTDLFPFPFPVLPPPTPQFRRVYQVLLGYVAGELSALYLDTSKDRLYIQAPGSDTRRACQTVQAAVLKVGAGGQGHGSRGDKGKRGVQ